MADFQGKQFFQRHKSGIEKGLLAVAIVLILLVAVLFVFCMRAEKVVAPASMPTLPTTTTTVPTTTTIATTTTKVTYDYTMKIDMESVRAHHAQKQDVVGWIYIEDTVVNYPVVQGTDNDFYINHDWEGNSSHSGCIYEDFRGKIDTSQNTLFYGHNMANGSMFSAIKGYTDPEWGKAHRYFEVASLDKRYLYEIVSVNIVNGEAGADFEYWKYLDMDRRAYLTFLQKIKETSTVWYLDGTDMPEYGKNRMIALQTCNSGADDGIRCVLFARCLGEY